MPRYQHASENAAQSQRYDPDRAIDKSDFSRCQAKSTCFARVEEKRRDHPDQLRFGKPIEQQEQQENNDPIPAEEGAEGANKLFQERTDVPRTRQAG